MDYRIGLVKRFIDGKQIQFLISSFSTVIQSSSESLQMDRKYTSTETRVNFDQFPDNEVVSDIFVGEL